MRRVLICEDEPLLAADLALVVEEAGHAVCGVFHNARDALSNVGELDPDLAIIDLKLADGDTGAAVAHTLQSLGIRVIILSGNSNVGAGLGLVPHTFAPKPVSKEVMVQLLGPGEHAATKSGPSLQCRDQQRPTMESSILSGRSILIAEDEPLIALDIAEAFKDAGATTVVSSTLHQALVLVEHDGLSAAVLDHVLSDGDSSPLCQRLNERKLPFLVYSGLGKLHGACAKGAHIKKPENPQALVSTVARLIAGNYPSASAS